MGRQKKNIKSRKQFAVLVEGESESLYIQILQRHEVVKSIKLEPKLPQKKKLQDLMKKVEALLDDYDRVFWIIDLDVILKEDRENKKTLQKLKTFYNKVTKKYKERLVIIINNPCFEFWLLLHFVHTSKPFQNCTKVIQELKKHLPDYEKSRKYYTKQNDDIYQKLRPHLETAIQNAKKVGRVDFDNPHQSISEMFLFFEDDDISELIFDGQEKEEEQEKTEEETQESLKVSEDEVKEFENTIELLEKLLELYHENIEIFGSENEEVLQSLIEIQEQIEGIREILESLEQEKWTKKS